MNLPKAPQDRACTLAALMMFSTATALAQGSSEPDLLNDYLVNVGAGHIAANEIIGLAGSAVSNLQTPKDLVASLAALGDPSSKNGFGVAWSPGRSGSRLMGVSAAQYGGLDAKPLHRLWGSTTFSYAQNVKTINGTDHQQMGAAVNVSYYWNPASDPMVAGYRAFSGIDGGVCPEQSKAFDSAAKALGVSLNQQAARRAAELQLTPDQDLPAAELDAIARRAKADVDTLKANGVGTAKALRAKRDGASSTAADLPALDDALAKLGACADKASKDAADKWNAPHLDLVLGQGWIRRDGSGGDRLSLGRYVTLALAWSTSELPNSLFNLTLKRVDRELDLDTLATTPVYKASSIAAARFTYNMGAGHTTYALAEVSNAKDSKATVANAAYKWALGIDHALQPGMWIELRAGRSRVPGSTAEENKALFAVKFSPGATLPNAVR